MGKMRSGRVFVLLIVLLWILKLRLLNKHDVYITGLRLASVDNASYTNSTNCWQTDDPLSSVVITMETNELKSLMIAD